MFRSRVVHTAVRTGDSNIRIREYVRIVTDVTAGLKRFFF